MKVGHSYSPSITSLSNTRTSHCTYNTVQTQASRESPERTYHPTAHPSTHTPPPSTRSSLENSKKGDMPDPSLAQRSNSRLAPSKLHRYPWFQKPGSLGNFASFKTYLSHETTQPCDPSIMRWTQTLSHVPGEPSPPFAPSSMTFPPTHRELAVTSPKPTESYRWPPINGLEWSFNFPSQTNSASISATPLAVRQQAASSASLQTHWPTSSEPRASVPQANGWMTRFSSEYPAFTSPITTERERTPKRSSERQGGGSSKEADCGLVEVPDRTEESRNLTRTWLSPYETSPKIETTATLMTCRMSITYPTNWVYPGNAPRILTSVRPFPSLASSGILKKGQSHCDRKRRTNIFSRSRSGKSRGHTHWERSRNFMGNCVMPPWLTQMEDPTSPTWKPCSGYFMTVLTFHAPHPGNFPTTSIGGQPNSPNPLLDETSQRHTRSMISLLSQTQVQALASRLSSEHAGGHGTSFQDGTQIRETSDGPKQWVLNSSREPSHDSIQPTTKNTSKFMETTRESWKAGKEAVVETLASTRFSNVLRNSYGTRTSQSTPATYKVPKTLQTTLREGSTPKNPFSFHHSTSPMSSAPSSSTTTILQMTVDSRMSHLNTRFTPYPKSKPNTGRTWTMPSIPSPDISTKPKPRTNGFNLGQNHVERPISSAQATNLDPTRHPLLQFTSIPSPLRPDCEAKHRLFRWRPPAPFPQTSSDLILPSIDEDRIRLVLAEAYSDSTKATYGTGLQTFHAFCNMKGISESQRTPCGPNLLASFIATLIGQYSAQAIENYTYGLRAWHIIHRIPWKINPVELQTLFTSAAKNQPPKSSKAQKPPCTLEDLVAIRDHLDLQDPFDVAVFACLTTTFWTAARLGEFTIPRLDAFNPEQHVKRSDLKLNVVDRHGNRVSTFFIPWTKASKSQGEELNWAAQPQTGVDPERAMQEHLRINQFDDRSHLFQYRHQHTSRPMSKSVFLSRIRKALKDAGRKPITGHSLRVGGTLEYLLRGVDFSVVRVKGRWASEKAFTGYLRKHGQILAPYMQENPQLQSRFIHLAMPPVR